MLWHREVKLIGTWRARIRVGHDFESAKPALNLHLILSISSSASLFTQALPHFTEATQPIGAFFSTVGGTTHGFVLAKATDTSLKVAPRYLLTTRSPTLDTPKVKPSPFLQKA